MAKELFNSDFYTLPEQVQLNKEDIETNTTNIATNTEKIATNTSDITKLQDDIGKIKPNAWEERKFNVDMEGTPIEFTTYNPITDSNTPVNIQKSFIDKETYALTDAINSYSFTASSLGIFAYLVCGNPSLTLNELFGFEETAKDYIVLANTDVGGDGEYWLLINCRIVDTFSLFTSSLSFDKKNTDIYIDKISTADDKQEHSILTAKAVDQYYLKKTDASNIYLTKQDYDNRFDTGVISLTAQGLNKIKALTDTPNQVLELYVPSDFLELSQQPTGKDLKLQIIYNGSPLYDNIILHSNRTIGDYHNISSSSPKAVWYTGQAIITLTSQYDGLFDIAYQDGNLLGLHLITTF